MNAIGCVYTDVDRDYFNDSAEFTYINIDPGYQRLCARKALQYVRYRHTDTDLVRSARQQDFLRQMKQQVDLHGPDLEARPPRARSSAATPPRTARSAAARRCCGC